MRPINYAVIGVSILAAIIISLYVAQQSQPETPDLPVARQPDFELGVYGQTLTIEEVEKIVGYKIELPTYLPSNNELQMVKVDTNTKWSFVIYSPIEVDDSTQEKDLIDNNGFIIVNAPAPEVTDVDQEIRRFVEFGGKEIVMENTRGVGFTDIPLMPGYSEIHWWEDGLHRIVGANFGLDELSKIIESI